LPCGAVRAVVFAHRAPLPLGHVRTPHAPRRLALARSGETVFFGGAHGWVANVCAPCHVARGESVIGALATAASTHRKDKYASAARSLGAALDAPGFQMTVSVVPDALTRSRRCGSTMSTAGGRARYTR